MKRILFLLLLTVSVYGQNPSRFTKIQITGNSNSGTATKVNVQENDGTINTKPISELANYLEFASAVNLPVTGEQGKLYLTKDNNRLYRFNGTIYQELTTDISGKEDIANKQNSLAVDGTNTKYPTVTVVNTGLALKANLASPALTGTPTAPTATAGTNTTQIATTAFVTGANAGNVKLTGNQTISGVKTFSANTSYPLNNGVQLNNTSNNSTYGAGALLINNNGTGFGSSILNNSTGFGLGLLNMSTGSGLQMEQYSNGRLISLNNLGAGVGISLNNTLTGTGIRVDGSSSGNNFISGQNLTGTGFNYVGQNNGLNTFTVDKLGATTATSFIKSSAPATNILLAGGGDVAQSTFQPAITGLTTNYLPKWNGSGFGNSQIFDNGTNIGIGTTSPTFSKLQIKGDDGNFIGYFYNNSGTAGQVKGVVIEAGTNTSDFALLVNSSQGSPYYKINGNGNSLFGTIQDNLVDRLQVDGTISASSYTATSLPVFENNAAASSLAVGQFYRTSIGVLMVKF